jgi:hypothetical protein
MAIETYEYEKSGLRVTIDYDEFAFSPRDEDNLGTILYTSTNYILGDKMVSAEEIKEIMEDDNYLVLPVYAYIHSGITISTGPFSCPWDSGMAGIIYCSKQELKNGNITAESAKKILEAEIEAFDKYLRGEVYRFVIEKPDKCDKCGHVEWETVDSCGGFDDLKYMKEEIDAIVEDVSNVKNPA